MESAREVVEGIAQAKLGERSADLSAALNIISKRIYAEDTHFLLELLQNAEDAGASEVEFTIRPDGLTVWNDGRSFDAEDVTSICSVGHSTKRAGRGYIGFFGIGFKSIFTITERPRIFSGAFRFGFDREHFGSDREAPWQIVPLWLEEESPRPARTVFELPFVPAMSEVARRRLAEQFDQLDARLLLFLNQVRRIVVVDEITGVRRAVERTLQPVDLVVLRGGGPTQRWRVLRQSFDVPDEIREDPSTAEVERQAVETREVVVALAVDGKGNLIAAPDDRLYCYLPTDQRTGLRFLIHSDFVLTAQRDRVQSHLVWNRWLAGCAAEVLASGILGIRASRRWRHQLYEPLPLRHEVDDPFFREHLERPLLERLAGSEIAAAEGGHWVRPGLVVFADDQLRPVIDWDDLERLAGEGSRFAAGELNERAHHFLARVGGRTFELDRLLDLVKRSDWLESKARSGDIGWFARLYGALYELLYERRQNRGRTYDYIDAKAALQGLAIVPTRERELVRGREVFFPLFGAETSGAAVEGVLRLVGGVRFLHPDALGGGVSRNRRRVLTDLGVSEARPVDLASRWLAPFLANGGWRERSAAERLALAVALESWLVQGEIEPGDPVWRQLGELPVAVGYQTDDGRRATAGRRDSGIAGQRESETENGWGDGDTGRRDGATGTDGGGSTGISVGGGPNVEWAAAQWCYLGAAYGGPGDLELALGPAPAPFVSRRYLELERGEPETRVSRWRALFEELGAVARLRIRAYAAVSERGELADFRAPPGEESGWGEYVEQVIEPALRVNPGRCELRMSHVEHVARVVAAKDAAASAALFRLVAVDWTVWLEGATVATLRSLAGYHPVEVRLPSFFGWLLREGRWLPTKGGVRRPGESYVPSAGVDEPEIATATLEVLGADEIPGYDGLVAFLGVRTGPSVGDLLSSLERLAGREPAEVTGELGRVLRRLADRATAGDEGWEGLLPRLLPSARGGWVARDEAYRRDHEVAHRLFADRADFLWLPPGDTPARYGALADRLGLRSARASFGAGVAGDLEAGPAPQVGEWYRTRHTYLASLALHFGWTQPPRNLEFRRATRLLARYHLDALVREMARTAFAAGAGAPVYVGVPTMPDEGELATALVTTFGWPVAAETYVELVFRLEAEALAERLAQWGVPHG
ncbi:MAG: hypothetical protein HY329_20760 [Chloroflexi bacterium]|nr:hypothetical protein [Chloroflexota bacterium]